MTARADGTSSFTEMNARDMPPIWIKALYRIAEQVQIFKRETHGVVLYPYIDTGRATRLVPLIPYLSEPPLPKRAS